ncbi:MAG: type II secretion system protein GspG [Proteobacteria bacterium]|nr:type II secretion system protein GspG [Pseudomonadota bacterium]
MRMLFALLLLAGCEQSAQLYEDTQKVDETKKVIQEVDTAIAMYRTRNQRLPKTVKTVYPRRAEPTDGWGNAFEYVRPGRGTRKWDVISLGADAAEGGVGVNADLRASDFDG